MVMKIKKMFWKKGDVNLTFSIEELTFLNMYKANSIENTRKEIENVMSLIDDIQMASLANSVLSKLGKMSSDEFDKIDFSMVLID